MWGQGRVAKVVVQLSHDLTADYHSKHSLDHSGQYTIQAFHTNLNDLSPNPYPKSLVSDDDNNH